MEKNYIDSSTLINKLLELIEAHKLFKIPSKKLDIIIHPDSLCMQLYNLKMVN